MSFFYTPPNEKYGQGDVLWGRISAVTLGVLIGLIVTYMAVMPSYRLYRASVEKRILVEQARAQKDAATQLAQAEITRSKGVAEANRIIANSITPSYLRYFYIQQLAEVESLGGKIIYVPTEAGLPILEAGRLEQEGATP